jgi:hypothetical protein
LPEGFAVHAQRSATLAALEALPPDEPLIVLATGRLHRPQAGKTSVRIIDWLDLCHPAPQRMWERRLRGYRAMGYALMSDP